MQRGNKSTRKKSLPGSSSSGASMPKISKEQMMPDDFKIRAQPLYSLPEELLKFPPKPTKSSKKQQESNKVVAKKRPTVIQSYNALRKAKEEFRNKLMNLICQSAPGEDGDGRPPTEEENKLRYYYYIHYGLDTIHVAPLDNRTILRVHNLLTLKLRSWKETLFAVTSEMREDFIMSMKKAIVDFVLKDPNTKDETGTEGEFKNEEVFQDGTLRGRYALAKTTLTKELWSVNPCIAQVLQIWWKQFNDLRLISMKDIETINEAYELQDFCFVCKRHMEAACNVLTLQWIPTLQAVFLQGIKKKQIPDSKYTRKTKHFYDCLACIMTYNLQTLCLKSMKDFTEYIMDVTVSSVYL